MLPTLFIFGSTVGLTAGLVADVTKPRVPVITLAVIAIPLIALINCPIKGIAPFLITPRIEVKSVLVTPPRPLINGAPSPTMERINLNPPVIMFKNSFENFVIALIKKGNLGKILNNNLPINFKKPPSIAFKIPPNILLGFFLLFGFTSVSSSFLSVSSCFSLSLLLSFSLCCFSNPSLTFDNTNLSFNNPSILTTFFLMIIKLVTPSLDKSALLEVLFDNSFEVSIISLYHS